MNSDWVCLLVAVGEGDLIVMHVAMFGYGVCMYRVQ